MFTRQDYMENKCSHSDYYGQFVTSYIKTLVGNTIGIDKLKQSTNPHFNDITLIIWDRMAQNNKNVLAIRPEFGEWPGTTVALWNLATAVCILKEAARQIVAK